MKNVGSIGRHGSSGIDLMISNFKLLMMVCEMHPQYDFIMILCVSALKESSKWYCMNCFDFSISKC